MSGTEIEIEKPEQRCCSGLKSADAVSPDEWFGQATNRDEDYGGTEKRCR
jgi:hypothetical protein